jgi:hypothetical protein
LAADGHSVVPALLIVDDPEESEDASFLEVRDEDSRDQVEKFVEVEISVVAEF